MKKIIITETQFIMLLTETFKETGGEGMVDEKSVYGVWKKPKKKKYDSWNHMSWQNKKSWNR